MTPVLIKLLIVLAFMLIPAILKAMSAKSEQSAQRAARAKQAKRTAPVANQLQKPIRVQDQADVHQDSAPRLVNEQHQTEFEQASADRVDAVKERRAFEASNSFDDLAMRRREQAIAMSNRQPQARALSQVPRQAVKVSAFEASQTHASNRTSGVASGKKMVRAAVHSRIAGNEEAARVRAERAQDRERRLAHIRDSAKRISDMGARMGSVQKVTKQSEHAGKVFIAGKPMDASALRQGVLLSLVLGQPGGMRNEH